MKKALLINPPGAAYIRDDRCQVPARGLTSSLRMPLDLAYMAAGLERAGFICRIKDYPAEKQTALDFIKELKEFEPDILVVSTTTPTLENDLADCALAREIDKKLLIVIKGAQVAVEAREILQKYSAVDIGIKQEYEMAIEEIGQGKARSNILGIAYRENGLINENQDRPYLSDLDRLPLPARHLINNKLYVRPDTLEPQTSILASRGCGRGCMFCLVKTVSGEKINFRSTESIVSEIKKCLSEFGIKDFYFRADTFTANRSWVIDLCRQIIKADLKINWVCNSRVDTIDQELIQIMKQAGCWMIGFGLESGDQSMLDKMGKGINLAQIEKAVKFCQAGGLKTYLFFIYGLPWETEQSLEKTLRFALALEGDFVEFHQAYPFPGTDYYKLALENNLFERNELAGTNVFCSPARSFELDRETLHKFRKKAMRKFYLRKKYISKKLKDIDSLKKFKNYFRKAINVFCGLW